MAIDVDALNYPYIRIRSVDWLKRTLLIFPHVVRMTPLLYAPADDPAIDEFCHLHGVRGPLLRSADLYAPHVHTAQRLLMNEIKTRLNENERAFKEKFGRKAARRKDWDGYVLEHPNVWDRRLSGRPTFQIHSEKVLWELQHFLQKEGLAWEPSVSDSSDGPGYIEMHARLGEAVMATLAFACAENEGLQVVTEFPAIHGRVINQGKSDIFSACLDEEHISPARPGDLVAEFIVYRRCDASKLTGERILALHNEGQALLEFRAALEELAKSLPPTIRSERVLQQRLDDHVNDIFKKWDADRTNMSSYVSAIFGDGLLDEPEALVKKVAETATGPTGGALIGTMALQSLEGAAYGFAVGLMFRALRAWQGTKRAEAKSPFRYLTLMEKSGVSFVMAR